MQFKYTASQSILKILHANFITDLFRQLKPFSFAGNRHYYQQVIYKKMTILLSLHNHAIEIHFAPFGGLTYSKRSYLTRLTHVISCLFANKCIHKPPDKSEKESMAVKSVLPANLIVHTRCVQTPESTHLRI